MSNDKGMMVEIQPIIDSNNPPISVDSVILGQSGTGAIRLACFAGDAFIERKEIQKSEDKDVKKLWIRPVCVLDIGNEAIRFLESYLLYRLSENANDMYHVQKSLPEAMKKLYETLKHSMESDNNV